MITSGYSSFYPCYSFFFFSFYFFTILLLGPLAWFIYLCFFPVSSVGVCIKHIEITRYGDTRGGDFAVLSRIYLYKSLHILFFFFWGVHWTGFEVSWYFRYQQTPFTVHVVF